MIDLSTIDYAVLDRPEILNCLFHPRPDIAAFPSSGPDAVIRIPVEKGIRIGAKFHMVDKASPVILFFHGNGEIVSDYDDMAMIYQRMKINFFPVDYRGYGFSDGFPTVTSMLRDAHMIFAFVKEWLTQHDLSGPLVVMGRSLGSASALEIAASYPDQFSGLVIESGFAFAVPLLRLVGVDVDKLGITEESSMSNLEKMRSNRKPARIIHAEFDHIIPFSDGVALYDACPVPDKKLVMIEGADHNSIFYHGMELYMKTLRDFLHGENPL